MPSTTKRMGRSKLPGKFKSRTSLKRELDRLFSLKVRARGHCEAAEKDDVRCGGPLQTCHLEGRRNLRLRWDESNALCMCAGHHRHYSDFPVAWAEFLRRMFHTQWDYVRVTRNERFDGDLGAILERLRDGDGTSMG